MPVFTVMRNYTKHILNKRLQFVVECKLTQVLDNHQQNFDELFKMHVFQSYASLRQVCFCDSVSSPFSFKQVQLLRFHSNVLMREMRESLKLGGITKAPSDQHLSFTGNVCFYFYLLQGKQSSVCLKLAFKVLKISTYLLK